tara:strand:- start:633 stop:1658 length:1026 start_codon:yes stop_codon:yes gene_type:complete
MSRINTISEFLLHGGTDYRVFDMGRAIRPQSSQTFLDFELTHIPAPYPRQQHAWFGIIFINKGLSQEHYIWFVKLPLDEQGKLISAARNQFLQIVVEALGAEMEKSKNAQAGLPENPFTFVPNQQQLASFNSITRHALALAPSQYFELTQQYLHSPQNIDWQQLSLQGIADLGARINEESIHRLLLQQFAFLAAEVQRALCDSLENHPLDSALGEIIVSEWRKHPAENDFLLAMLRALSQCEDGDLITSVLLEVLSHDERISDNLLVLIAARHWQQLANQQIMSLFIHRLSQSDVNLFGGLFRDLVQIPSCRDAMLNVLRWPTKEPALALRIKTLFESQHP